MCAIVSGYSTGIVCAGTDWMEPTTGPFHGVATGNGFTCGLSTSHKLSCWKRPNAADSSLVPAGIDTSSDFLDIVAGETHVCGLKPSGEAACFGVTAQPPASTLFISLSAGNRITCGVTRTSPSRSGGQIACWSDDGPSHPLMTNIPSGPFIDVAVGDNTHACGLSCNGSISCWGPQTAAYAPLLSGVNRTSSFVYLSAGGGDTCGVEVQADGTSKKVRCASGKFSQSMLNDVVEVSVGGRGAVFVSPTHLSVSASPPLASGFVALWPNPGCDNCPVGVQIACSYDGSVVHALRVPPAVSYNGGVDFSNGRIPFGMDIVATTADGASVYYGSGNGRIDSARGSCTASGKRWSSLVVSSVKGQWHVLAADNGGFLSFVSEFGSPGSYSSLYTCQLTETGEARAWKAVAASANFSRLFAAATGAQIYVSTNMGASWAAKGPSKAWIALAASADGLTAIAAPAETAVDSLYISRNGGDTWAAVSATPQQIWTGVAISPNGLHMVAGGSLGVVVSHDGGVTWASLALNGYSGFKVAISAEGDRIFATSTANLHAMLPFCNTAGAACLPSLAVTVRVPASEGEASFVPRIYIDTLTLPSGLSLLGAGPLISKVKAVLTETRIPAGTVGGIDRCLSSVKSLALTTPSMVLRLAKGDLSGLSSLTSLCKGELSSDNVIRLSSWSEVYSGNDTSSFSFDALDGLQSAVAVSLPTNVKALTTMSPGIVLRGFTSVKVLRDASAPTLELRGKPFLGLPSVTAFNLQGDSPFLDFTSGNVYVGQPGTFDFSALEGLSKATDIRVATSRLEPMTGTVPSVSSLTVLKRDASGVLLKERALDGFTGLYSLALSGIGLHTSVGTDGTKYLSLSTVFSSFALRNVVQLSLSNNDAVILPAAANEGPFFNLTWLFLCGGNIGVDKLFATPGGLHAFPNVVYYAWGIGRYVLSDALMAPNCGISTIHPDTFSPHAGSLRRRWKTIDLASNAIEDHRIWRNVTLDPSKVEKVYLEDNRIASVAPPGFEDASSLQELYLSNNPIRFFDSTALSPQANRVMTTITTENTQILATRCPAGMFSGSVKFETGATTPACFRCIPGGYCPGNNVQVPCPSGTYSNRASANDSSVCRPCPAGTYQELEGQSRLGCVACGPGFYSPVAGAASLTVCSACERGRYAAEGGKSTCTSCPAGRHHRDGAELPADTAEECVACGRGKYSSTVGAVNSTYCSACPSGFTTDGSGASSADECSVDIRRGCGLGFGWDESASGCRACGRGFYGSTGLLGCQPCPRGTYWVAPPVNTGRSSGGLEVCAKCAPGRFSVALNATSSAVCQTCAFGFRPSDEGSGCVGCPQNTIPKANASAPYGFSCSACASTSDSGSKSSSSDSPSSVCAAGVTVPLPRSSSLATNLGSWAPGLRSLPFGKGRLLATSVLSSSSAYATTTIPSQTVSLQSLAASSSSSSSSSGGNGVPAPRFSISDSDTAGKQNSLPGPIRSFVTAPYALAVAIALASFLPVLILLIPKSRLLFEKARPVDAFSTARPLQDGDAVQKFTSPLGSFITVSYILGIIAGAAVLSLAWVSDNAAYTSSLRPLLASFPWVNVGGSIANAPLEISLGFAADASASCSGLQLVSSSSFAAPKAQAFGLVPATTTASSPTLCAVQVSFPTLQLQTYLSSFLVSNVSLVLPPSAQAMAFAASGMLTTTSAVKAGTDGNSTWVSEAVEVSSTSASFGISSVDITLSVMPLVEDDQIRSATTYGLLLVGTSAVVNERTTAEVKPGVDTVTVNVIAVPSQQYLAVTVYPRSSVTELLAAIVGFVSGLYAFYKGAYSFLYGLIRNAYGEPSWEVRAREEAAKRQESKHAGPSSTLGKLFYVATESELVKRVTVADGTSAANVGFRASSVAAGMSDPNAEASDSSARHAVDVDAGSAPNGEAAGPDHVAETSSPVSVLYTNPMLPSNRHSPSLEAAAMDDDGVLVGIEAED